MTEEALQKMLPRSLAVGERSAKFQKVLNLKYVSYLSDSMKTKSKKSQ